MALLWVGCAGAPPAERKTEPPPPAAQRDADPPAEPVAKTEAPAEEPAATTPDPKVVAVLRKTKPRDHVEIHLRSRPKAMRCLVRKVSAEEITVTLLGDNGRSRGGNLTIPVRSIRSVKNLFLAQPHLEQPHRRDPAASGG